MSNPSSRKCDDLQLDAECAPDPVLATGATHGTTIENHGGDRYRVPEILVRVVDGTLPGTSVGLQDGGSTVDAVRWYAGTFGRGLVGSWSHPVVRLPQGTARAHSFRTTVVYSSDAERDPQDDEPGPSHSCQVTLDVAVP